MKGPSFVRRLALALLAVATLSSGMAHADPVDEAQNIVASVSDVRATGTGPRTIFVSWHNNSVWPLIVFRIETSFTMYGPWLNALPNNGLVDLGACNLDGVCVMPVKGLTPAADPRIRWFRVVPIATAPAAPRVSGTTVQPGDPTKAPALIEGKASEPDPAVLGPLAPTNVLCNGGTNDSLTCVNVNSVTITWDDNSDEAEFWVMRAKAPINPSFGGNPRYQSGRPDVTSYSEVLSDFSSTFWYRVVAVRKTEVPPIDGASFLPEVSFSNCVDSGDPADGDDKHYCAARVETAPVPPPSDPSGLVAQFIPPNSAKLTWTDGAAPGRAYVEEDGWFMEMGTEPGAFQTQLTRGVSVGQGTVTYLDVNIPPDTTRCYRIRGYRFGPAFSNFTPRSDQPGVCLGTTPRAPTNLIAVAISNATTKLTWVDNSASESSFIIERCPGVCTHGSSGWAQIGEVLPNTTTFDDSSTSGLTTYSYRVFAVNASGRSTPSNVATVTTLRAPLPAPSNLVTLGLQHAIRLTWTDNSTTETGFRIEVRDTASLEWSILTDDIARNITTYTDRGLAARQTRCYRVRAVKADPELSDPTPESCATTLPPQKPDGDPTNVTTDVQSNVKILVSWSDNATNEDGYKVEYYVFPDVTCAEAPVVDDRVPFAQLARVSASDANARITMRYQAAGLIPHSAYFFRVKAYNQDGESAFSPISACAQTYGPPRPKFKDPSDRSHTDTTRCDFTITAPATDAIGHDYRAGGLMVFVNAVLANSSVATTDALYVIGPGGTVPGSETAPDDGKHFVKTQDNGGLTLTGNDWKITYKFRHGINYRILAQSFTYYEINGVHYSSATQQLIDLKVLADCPMSGL